MTDEGVVKTVDMEALSLYPSIQCGNPHLTLSANDICMKGRSTLDPRYHRI